MADIARMSGVSVPTVSYILNGRAKERNLSEATTKRVIETARSLGYVRNTLARNLRRNESHAISLLVSDLSRNWSNRLIRGVIDVLDPAGYMPSVSVHLWDPERERKELQTLIETRTAAIILYPMGDNVEDYRRVSHMGIPLVMLDVPETMPEASYAIWDCRKAVRASVRHLLETGRRRIGFYYVHIGTLLEQMALEAYRAGLQEAGIEADPRWVCADRRYALKQMEGGRYEGYGASVKELFGAGGGNLPDSFIVINDALALMCIGILRDELGFNVPQDIAVMGMDDVGESYLAGLSTTYEPLEEVGRCAAQAALELLKGSPSPVQKSVTDFELRVRATTPPVARRPF
jgi:LacI family transcriptional regulator